jgi:hypothetical protein
MAETPGAIAPWVGGRQSANKNGGEGGILPQTPEIFDRNSLIEPSSVFSDTLDVTPEEIRSQEPMKVTISRKAEIISALL